MIQLLLGVIIIGIGIAVFKCYPIKKDVAMLSKCGLFVIIVMIINRLSIMVPLFGLESFQIGFETLAIMLVGVILPPSYAYLCGLVIDFGGLLINPTGFPFLGFTLNSVMQILIPSIMMYHYKQNNFTISLKLLKIVFLVILSCTSLYFLSLDTLLVSGVEFSMKVSYKVFVVLLLVSFGIGLFYMLQRKEIKKEETEIFTTWIVIILFVEFSVTLLLTPLWLDIMYGIPFLFSLFLRVLKLTIMIPIDIFVGYRLYKILQRL